MFDLYDHSTSVCSAKVRVLLAEKAIEFTGHFVDILAGDQFTPEYRKINPRAVVPALIHDGQTVIESTVINEYLDEVVPLPPLTPSSPHLRARMRVWTKGVDERLHDACTVITYVVQHRHKLLELDRGRLETMLQNTSPIYRDRKRSWVLDGFASPDLQTAVGAFDLVLTEMETALMENPWLAGETYSLADVAMTPYINRLSMLAFDDWWRGDRPAVTAWFDAIRQRASFQTGVMDHIPAAMQNEMRDRGTAAWPEIQALLSANHQGQSS